MISTTKTAATLYTTRTPQEIAFSESTVNYDVDAGGDFAEPTLEGVICTPKVGHSYEVNEKERELPEVCPGNAHA